MRFSQNQLLLYRLFLSYPDRKFYMQEIGRILKKKPGVFQRTLNKLEESGFVASEYQANARYFQLNRRYPFLREISSIIRKSTGEMNIFKEIIRELDRDRRGKPRRRKPRPKPAPDAGSDEKTRRRGARLSDYHKDRLLTQLDPDRSIEDSGAPAAKPHSRKEPAAAWENRKIKKDKTASRPKPSSQDQLELF